MMSAPSLCTNASGVGHHVHWTLKVVTHTPPRVNVFIVSYLSTLSVSPITPTPTPPPDAVPVMIDASIVHAWG